MELEHFHQRQWSGLYTIFWDHHEKIDCYGGMIAVE
jgi:hypothetical protein